MIIAAATVGGSIVPAAPPPNNYVAADFTQGSFCFVTPDDLVNPGVRETENPLQTVYRYATPLTVPARFFGTHSLNSNMPSGVSWGYLRSHDSAVRWDQIELSEGIYSWATMDVWVGRAEFVGALPIYTIFGTPIFYSSAPAQVCHYPGKPGIAAPPTDLTKLGNFLTALQARYGTRVRHFEVWNEVNIVVVGGVAAFWGGTNIQLVDLACRVYDTVKSNDAGSIVLGPSTQGWGQGFDGIGPNANEPAAYLTTLLAQLNTAGTRRLGDVTDWMTLHMYYPFGITRQIGRMVAKMRAVLTAASLSKPIFDTESGFIDLQYDASLYNDQKYLTLMTQMILAHAASGLIGTCFYAYDHSGMGFRTRPGITNAIQSVINSVSGKTITSAVQQKFGAIVIA